MALRETRGRGHARSSVTEMVEAARLAQLECEAARNENGEAALASRHRRVRNGALAAGVVAVTIAIAAYNEMGATAAGDVRCSEVEIVGADTTFLGVADRQLDALHSDADRYKVASEMAARYREQTGEGAGNLDPATKTQTCVIGHSGIDSVHVIPIEQ